MVQQGIMNRLVYGLYEETPIFSFICICLPMHQNSWQWIFLNNRIVTCLGVGQQTLVLKFFYSFADDIFISIR